MRAVFLNEDGSIQSVAEVDELSEGWVEVTDKNKAEVAAFLKERDSNV